MKILTRPVQAAIHIAARFGHTEFVMKLLDNGAYMEQTDGSGNTALHIAALNRRVDTVGALVIRAAQRVHLPYAFLTPKSGRLKSHYYNSKSQRGDATTLRFSQLPHAYHKAAGEPMLFSIDQSR